MTAWKVTLPCSRAEAEAIAFADDAFADLADPPTLLTDEPDPARPDDWRLHAYLAAEPDAALLARIAALAPSRRAPPVAEPLADTDWVTLSQAGLAPVRAGRFLVHTPEHRAARRPGDLALEIPAGLAFGTGQHMTTYGCLSALDALAKHRRFATVLDLGTGTGVLAFAAARRWPRARVIASDIDPVSVAVARANARRNALRPGRGRGRVELVTAIGMRHPRLLARAPYDLILANILAAPLVALAGDIAAALAPGGVVVLAGLLDSQVRRVSRAYAARGLVAQAQHPRGEWPTLVLRKPVRVARHGTTGSRAGQGRARSGRRDARHWTG